MNRQSELLKNIDWLSIFLYTLLVFMGWLNIYAAVYDESHSNILDIDLKSIVVDRGCLRIGYFYLTYRQ